MLGRLYGCYERLEFGWNSEAMVDFTGGLSETYQLKPPENPQHLFNLMTKAIQQESMIGAAIFQVRYIHLNQELHSGGATPGRARSNDLAEKLPS